jgi:FdhD protein
VTLGVSAASSLAVELAKDVGLTMVGFVRGDSFVIYSDTGRIEL